MLMAIASHENHPYDQYVGLWVRGHEGNHVRLTEWNKGKNTAQKSPATRTQVNSYSEFWVKAGCRAARGKHSALQWLLHLRHCARTECLLARGFYIPELISLQDGGKKNQNQKTSYQAHPILKFWRNAAIWLPKFLNNKHLYFQFN